MNAILRSKLLRNMLVVMTGLLACAMLETPGIAQTTYWEIEPVKDPRVASGTFSTIGGRTTPAGVHFKLMNNQLNAPVVITLTAQDKTKPLRIRAFKDSGELFVKDTDASGIATQSFRTGEDIKFAVTGDKGAAYQLSVWRGPQIILPPPSPVQPMSDISPPHEITTAAPEKAGGGSMTTVLLTGIFVVLMVIAVLMFRGQQMKDRVPLILLPFLLVLTPAYPQEENIDIRPRPVADADQDARHAEQIQGHIDKFKEITEAIKTITEGKIDFNSPIDIKSLEEKGFKGANVDIASLLQTTLNLLEAFEIIDPREKFLQPDYSPPGLPILPSRASGDGSISPEAYGAFRDLQGKINKAKTHLEGNYVVLKQTELKTKRLEELADSAGGFSAIAGLYWAKSKADPNDPMNKSKAGFYEKYDGGQESGLKFLNDTLKEMAEFELKRYGDRNWYLYFGLPYYNFMVARYVRK
jgi:hypothetical protein|uniref:hypothetical protein n=1 Tax=Prosthecobacter sp. TaxID=1965333 RepID=UPI0037845A02